MGPIKVLGRAVNKVADKVMMTLIGNDATYIYNVSWVSRALSVPPLAPPVHFPRPCAVNRATSYDRRSTNDARLPAQWPCEFLHFIL
jgi:hypothetical protein